MSNTHPAFLAVALSAWTLWTALGTATGHADNEFQITRSTGLELGGEAASVSRPAIAPGSAGEPGKPGGTAADRQPTEITASRETTFDEKARVAVFTGDVKVVDAQFNLSCDKLTAYLHKPSGPDKKGGEGAAAIVTSSTPTTSAVDPAKPGQKANPHKSGGLERVVAEGNVLITQDKVAANGEVTHYVGKAARAEYNATTGDVTLTGWPQIQQGINNQVATEEGTVMILNRAGRLKAIGPTKTVIQESSDPPRSTNSTNSTRSTRSIESTKAGGRNLSRNSTAFPMARPESPRLPLTQ